MKNLMTRKIVLGMLMTLVLAFGVQSISDALTLSATSDVVQSKRVGSSFEITFSVGLTSDTRAYNTARDLVNAGYNGNAEGTQRIDSSGYKVFDASDNREYRLSANAGALSGTLVVGPRPRYKTDSQGISIPSTQESQTPVRGANNALYVTTGNDVVDANGDAVYIRTGMGDRRTENTADDPWLYERAEALPDDPIDEEDRFDYNEESIEVMSSKSIMLRDKRGGYLVLDGDTTGNMMEDADYNALTSSVTLVCESPDEGAYTITITDDTPETDYPKDTAPPQRSKIEFTLYVTGEDVTDDLSFSTGTGTLKKVDTADATEPVSSHFALSALKDVRIRYQVVEGSGSLYVGTIEEEYTTPTTDLAIHKDASVYLKTNGTTNEVVASVAGFDPRTDGLTIVFEYTGSGRRTSTTTPTTPTTPITPTLVLSPSSLTGSASASQQLIASVRDQNGNPAVGIGVTFTLSPSGSGFVSPLAITNSSGIAQTTVVLPNTNAFVTASAVVGGSSVTQSASIAVTTTTEEEEEEETTGEPAEIVIYDGDEQVGQVNQRLDADLIVEVLDRNNNPVSFELVRFRVVEGSGRLSPTSTRTDRDGLASVTFTPRSQGTIEVEAYLGDLSPVIFTITTGEPPDAIKKVSGDNQGGRPGAVLANPFVVEVVDENGDPVSGTTVSFASTAGGGSVSPTSTTTNSNGRAQTTLTLGEAVGDNTVTARVTGIPAVTFSASAGATVHVDAANRAPLYWISGAEGKLHRLVDDEVENLAPNVTGITSVAVDAANGLLYFAVQTGNNKGAIRRSGLNGKNVQTLKTLTAVPMGIALDAAGSTVYWTNSRGRIQSIAAEGSSQLTNLLQDLANPTAIVVSNGYVYWAEPLGRIRRASLTANQQVAVNVATGLGEPLSLAIAKGKIYWVERSGSGGALQRANLNGTNVEQLKSFSGGVPTSIAVDGSANKLYWTRSTGKVQRSNLMGRFTADIVTGLMGPGGLALGGVMAEPVVQQVSRTTQPSSTTQPATTTYSKFDINRDGSVNNADTKAVAGAVGQSGAAITNPRTDVDGSGTVDVTDLILVIANLDDDVAAPAIDVDLKAMDLDFDRLQEQVEVLLSSGDRSHAAQRALMYLQHLLASARPDATVLLANYPNPFNPETWIPYHLASSTDVKLRIYDARGTLVRELVLGHQSAGYYTSRSRAAYWDGRNAFGERVASGIYFYQLQADEISPLRKMVILK